MVVRSVSPLPKWLMKETVRNNKCATTGNKSLCFRVDMVKRKYHIINVCVLGCLQTAGAARVEALAERRAERTCAAGAETTAAARADVPPHRTRDDRKPHAPQPFGLS